MGQLDRTLGLDSSPTDRFTNQQIINSEPTLETSHRGTPMNRITLALSGLFLSAAVVGCSEAADEIESQIDCPSICKKYSDCYDKDYDVEECSSDCKAEFDKDPEYINKIDACDSCIENKSCSESTFQCADECLGIVP